MTEPNEAPQPEVTQHWNGEGEHELKFLVVVRSWGHLDKVRPDAVKTLKRAVRLAFNDQADVHEVEAVQER